MRPPINDTAPVVVTHPEAANLSNVQRAFSTTRSTDVKVWPNTGSIKRQVLDALRAGQRVTSLDAWLRFGTSRLAALVFQLRAAGWQIESEDVVVETAHGHKAHIARYSMEVNHGD